MNWTSKQQDVLKKYLKEDNWIDLMMQLYISADEVSLGKLDEDMTENEYMQYGPSDAVKEITAYYSNKGQSFVATSAEGIHIYGGEKIEPYRAKEKKNGLFSLEERRKICEVAHLLLEKREISKEEAKIKLEI